MGRESEVGPAHKAPVRIFDDVLRNRLREPNSPDSTKDVFEFALGETIPMQSLLNQGSDDPDACSTLPADSADECGDIRQGEGALSDTPLESLFNQPGSGSTQIDNRPSRRGCRYALDDHPVLREQILRLMNSKRWLLRTAPARHDDLNLVEWPVKQSVKGGGGGV
jgi:hypothetical protein